MVFLVPQPKNAVDREPSRDHRNVQGRSSFRRDDGSRLGGARGQAEIGKYRMMFILDTQHVSQLQRESSRDSQL